VKTRVLIAASLITSTLAFVPTTSVNAEGVVAAEIIQSYESAGAGFFSTDASGCVYTSVSASGIDFVIQKPPGPPEPVSDTFIGITKFDDCTQTRLMDATCSSLLAGPDFQVVGSLHSATLDTDLECLRFPL
jgi:hypothetical protein